MLARELGVEVPREQGRNPTVKVDETVYRLQQAERFYRSQLRSANATVDYLKGRGLTGEIAQDFGVGYAPANGTG